MKNNAGFDVLKRIMAVVLCAFIFVGYMPAMGATSAAAYANDSEAKKTIDDDYIMNNKIPETDIADSDELLMEYLQKGVKNEEERLSFFGKLKLKINSRKSKLPEKEQKIYEGLKTQIAKVAAGESDSAEFAVETEGVFNQIGFTEEELGTEILEGGEIREEATQALSEKFEYDHELIIDTLLADLPYELYWFDKTKGYAFGIGGISATTTNGKTTIKAEKIIFNFMVSKDYSAGNVEEDTAVDTAKTSRAASFIENASEIIAEYSNLSDAQKMEAYRREICRATEYEYDAADDGESQRHYGDPWQLISVFDGDDETNVVCEGYSKAFQFLCDNSDFNDGVEVDTVMGTMIGGTGEGRHMWNIAHMENGKNYLADITNCDMGSLGYADKLFLKKPVTGGSVADGYAFDCDDDEEIDVTYIYDNDTKKLFSNSELTLAAENYEYESITDGVEDRIEYLTFEDTNILKGSTEPIYISDIRVFVENEYGSMEYEASIGNVRVLNEWDEDGDPTSGIVNLKMNEGESYNGWEIKGTELGRAEIEYKFIDYNNNVVTETFMVNVTDEYYSFSIESGRYHMKPGQSVNFGITDIRRVHLNEEGVEVRDELTDEQTQGFSVEWEFENTEDTQHAILSDLTGLNGRINFAANDDAEFYRTIALLGTLKDSHGNALGTEYIEWQVANQFESMEIVLNDDGEELFNDGDVSIHAVSDYVDLDNLEDGYSLEFVVGEYTEGEEGHIWDPEKIYNEGLHYTVNSKNIILHGESLYKDGARNVVVKAVLKKDGETISESNELTYSIREAKEIIYYPENKKLLPEESFEVSGFGFNLHNSENPYGRDGECRIKSVEIAGNSNVIEADQDNPQQDYRGDYYVFRALATGQATLKVKYDMYFVEQNWETGEITKEELYKKDQECEILIDVVSEYYGVSIIHERGRYQGRPGTNITLIADATHSIAGEGMQSAEGVEYEWTITEGEEYASITQDQEKPERAIVTFNAETYDDYVYDNIGIKVSISKDGETVAEYTTDLQRVTIITEIHIEPDLSSDMSVGDTKTITAEVRHYPSEQENKEYDVIEDVRFMWNVDQSNSVEVTDSEGTRLGQTYNEETQEWGYIETENTRGSSCEFTVKRTGPDYANCQLIAIWNDGDYNQQIQMDFNFEQLDEGYDIEFQQAQYEIDCATELTIAPTFTGFDNQDYSVICKAGKWDGEGWQPELTSEDYSFNEDNNEITLNGAKLLEKGLTGADVWVGAIIDNDIVASGITYVSVEDHVWDAGYESVEPTEEAPGEMTYTCTVCKTTKTERIEPLPHTHTIIPIAAAEPTCTEAGNIAHYKCTICDKLFEDEQGNTEISPESVVENAKGHTPNEAVEENREEATCTADGSYDEVVYCSSCNAELSRTKHAIEMLGHNWGDWEIVESPNCTDAGSKKHKCSRCNIEEYEDVDANGHDWNKEYTVDKEPTCTEEGSRSVHCSVCGVINPETVETIEALNHNWSDWVKADDSKHARTCLNNPEHTEEEAHTWDEGTVVDAPSCMKEGIKEYACTKCEATRTDTLEKTPHNTEHHPAVSATYTAEGHIEYWQCKDCKKYFADATCVSEIQATDIIVPMLDGKEKLAEINSKVEDAESKAAEAAAKANEAKSLVEAFEEAANTAKAAAENALSSLKNEDIAAAEQAALNAQEKKEAAEDALGVAETVRVAADNLIKAAEDAIKQANEDGLQTGTATGRIAEAKNKSEVAATTNGTAKDNKDSADRIASEANTATEKAKQDRASLESSVNEKVATAETAAAVAENAAKAAEDAVATMESASEAAKVAAEKAAETKNANDIASAREKANEAKSRQAAAQKAIEDAEAARKAAEEAADEARECVQAAKNADISTGNSEERIDQAETKANDAATRTAAAKSNKDALDADINNADRTVSGLEKEQKDAAEKKAAEEAAAKKAAEAQKAADELKEWNGTVSGAVPKVKSAKFKAAKKKVTVSWKKATKKNLKKFDKVEVQVCPNKRFQKANSKRVEVKKTKKSATVKGLKKGTYYVRVRNVKGSGTGKLVSKWSKVKKVKVK